MEPERLFPIPPPPNTQPPPPLNSPEMRKAHPSARFLPLLFMKRGAGTHAGNHRLCDITKGTETTQCSLVATHPPIGVDPAPLKKHLVFVSCGQSNKVLAEAFLQDATNRGLNMVVYGLCFFFFAEDLKEKCRDLHTCC